MILLEGLSGCASLERLPQAGFIARTPIFSAKLHHFGREARANGLLVLSFVPNCETRKKLMGPRGLMGFSFEVAS